MQTQRLLKEYRSAGKVAIDNRDDMIYQLGPITDIDLTEWTAIIRGPPDTPYSGGLFTLDISISQNYPLEPPTILFRTKIFHPNVHWKTGEICLDILKTAWSAAFTLESVCRAIVVLMQQPEPDSPLNCDCGNLLRCGDYRGYYSLAKMYTEMYARPKK